MHVWRADDARHNVGTIVAVHGFHYIGSADHYFRHAHISMANASHLYGKCIIARVRKAAMTLRICMSVVDELNIANKEGSSLSCQMHAPEAVRHDAKYTPPLLNLVHISIATICLQTCIQCLAINNDIRLICEPPESSERFSRGRRF